MNCKASTVMVIGIRDRGKNRGVGFHFLLLL